MTIIGSRNTIPCLVIELSVTDRLDRTRRPLLSRPYAVLRGRTTLRHGNADVSQRPRQPQFVTFEWIGRGVRPIRRPSYTE